ncbi:pyridoxal-dependent decarboxylase [Actinophytocola sp.]|uniref:pyridoxal-dependent decarboxylase n=1 Tax=Actinophytocola sp. TaxID=1872138 RepID=UPI002ED2D135
MTLADYRKPLGTTNGERVVPPTDKDFELSPGGLDDGRRKAALDKLATYLDERKRFFLGYQTNQELGNRKDVSRFLDYNVNNVGDPFADSHFTMHTRPAERAVLDYYAKLWHAHPRTIDRKTGTLARDAYWGYVLTMGSSEGNTYGLWNARDYLSGKTLMREPRTDHHAQYVWVQDTAPPENLNAYSPVCFYSADTHYSVAKAIRVLDIPSFYELGTKRYPLANPLAPGKPWSHEVPSDEDGRINVDALKKLVAFFAGMGHPILVNLNYGSTFKGAYDDVETICAELRKIFRKYRLDRREVRYGRDADGNELVDVRTGYWIHVDGALGATYGPFLEKAIEAKRISDGDARLPKFDFRIPEVCSIVTSGHKYPGASWPCGVFMTKAKLQMLPPEQPAYIGSPDTTFGGSRNAFSPLIMWDFLARHSEQVQIDMIVKAADLADYAVRELRRLGANWAAARSPLALSVWFRQPPADIVAKYSLSTVPMPNEKGKVDLFAHLYVMPHVTKEMINHLVADLKDVRPAKAEHVVDGTDVLAYADGFAHDDVARLGLVRTWGHGF